VTTIPERVSFIRKIHLFSGLSDEHLKNIAEALTDEPFKEGDHIIEQGKPGETFYMLQRGRVKVVRNHGSNREVVLAHLIPQDYFGEEEVFSNRSRTATIIAENEVNVLGIHRSKLTELQKQVPALKPSFDVVISSRRLWRKLQFKWVRSDEVVYFLARKHPVLLWRALVSPLFALLLPVGLIFGGLFTGMNWLFAIALVIVIFCIGWAIWLAVDWGNDYYIVTNQRVVWMEKVVGLFDSRSESPLSTVLSVGVETDQLGRVLDYGNVVIRTFVGKIPFNHVRHPTHAARMIEEYWGRTKEQGMAMEKEAMKDAIRKRLGLPIPPKPAPPPAPAPKGKARRPNPIQYFLSNLFKLRLEDGDTVTYRKHVFILWKQVWKPSLILLLLFIFGVWRSIYIAVQPDVLMFTPKPGGGIPAVDTLLLALPILSVPFWIWWGYQYVDWKNDIFMVTPDQIFDIDKTPFGAEERRSAPLENILSTEAKRVGIWGNLLNFGTVYITVGGSKLEFQDVLDPNNVQSDIDRRRMARNASKAAAASASEREKMAEWIATYHRNADEFRKQEEEKNKPNPG